MTHYYALMKAAETGGFTVTFPDLPGCVAAGQNERQVLRIAGEALGRHANELVQVGSALPHPSSFMATVAKLAAKNEAVIYPVLLPNPILGQEHQES